MKLNHSKTFINIEEGSIRFCILDCLHLSLICHYVYIHLFTQATVLLLFMLLLCVDNFILCDDMLVYICPLDRCFGVLVITKSVWFPDSSSRSHSNYSFLILVWLLCFCISLELFSSCLIAAMPFTYACLFNCPICGMLLAFSLSFSSILLLITFMELCGMISEFI